MKTILNTELTTQESRLHQEIVSIQDEIELLLILLDRKQKALDEIQEQTSDLNLRGNVAA